MESHNWGGESKGGKSQSWGRSHRVGGKVAGLGAESQGGGQPSQLDTQVWTWPVHSHWVTAEGTTGRTGEGSLTLWLTPPGVWHHMPPHGSQTPLVIVLPRPGQGNKEKGLD